MMAMKNEIENVLSFLLASEGNLVKRSRNVVFDVPLTFFKAAEPFKNSLIESMPEEQKARPLYCANAYDDPLLQKDALLVEKNLDVSILQNVDDDLPNNSGWRFAISRIRTVSPATLRGKVAGGGGAINLELTSAFIRNDLTYETTRTYLGRFGSSFRGFDYTDRGIGRLDAEAHKQQEIAARMAVGIGVARRYMWSVRLGFLGVPSLNFLTDPTGALALLEARDKSVRGSRREAVVHWVSEHWRCHRKNPDVSSRVRAHFRGRTSFEWDGLQCEVLPSPADVESYERGEGAVQPPWESQ